MGDYPFPSDYMTGSPGHKLPAWPMREACKHMTPPPTHSTRSAATGATPPRVVTWPGTLLPGNVHNTVARRLLRSVPAAEVSDRGDSDEGLVESLCSAAGMLYNVTEDQTCFSLNLSGPAAGNSGAGMT